MKATECFVLLLCMARLAAICLKAQSQKASSTISLQDKREDSVTDTIGKIGGLLEKTVNAPSAITNVNDFDTEDNKLGKRNHLRSKKLGAKHLDEQHAYTQTNNNSGAKEKKKDVGNTKSAAKIPASGTYTETTTTKTPSQKRTLPMVVRPMGVLGDMPSTSNFDDVGSAFYSYVGDGIRELDSPLPRTVLLFPADFTDNTPFYEVLDSDGVKLSEMKIGEPYVQEECVPMQNWQTEFHPSCNEMHGLGMSGLGDEEADEYFHLFGTGGSFRHAWRVDFPGGRKRVDERESVVLKTLKLDRDFIDPVFEHNRIDAVAMEQLTSSPHVVNVFGFCGQSVLTEMGDGEHMFELVNKAKKVQLSRLKIALDIASGLGDVHGIDGDGNATLAHLDINPANVISVGGTLKINDFNIGQILLWNTTSNKHCGFSNAKFSKSVWRSPEEIKKDMLTEKADVFAMGHIFFCLICGHKPWKELEDGRTSGNEEIRKNVIAGVLPFVPESVKKTSDKEVIAIRDAMLKCYTYEPEKRPSARQIEQELRKALEKLTRARTASHKVRRK